MFAYIEDIRNDQRKINRYTLWVVNSHAEVLAQISINRGDFLGTPRWLSSERLILSTEDYETFLIIEPFTGKQSLISNELPLILKDAAPGLLWRAEYSPDLEKVVYYYYNNQDKVWRTGSVLWDVGTQQNLWRSKGGDESKPVWSPDGQEVAASGWGQLYLVNRLGQAKPILNEKIPQVAQSPAWSADGHYIAFWNDRILFVYDKQKEQVFDLCIPFGSGAVMPKPPLWTPDSQQIIVLTYTPENPTGFPVLVNIRGATAYIIPIPSELTNTGFLGAWMNSIP